MGSVSGGADEAQSRGTVSGLSLPPGCGMRTKEAIRTVADKARRKRRWAGLEEFLGKSLEEILEHAPERLNHTVSNCSRCGSDNLFLGSFDIGPELWPVVVCGNCGFLLQFSTRRFK